METQDLPDLKGYGVIKDLSAAMTLDVGLRSGVEDIVDNARSLSIDSMRSAFEEVLLRWCGADNVLPGTRGIFVNAQHLAVVEAFYGESFMRFGAADPTNPWAQDVPSIEESYNAIRDTMMLKFLSQVPVSDLLRSEEDEALSDSPILAMVAIAYDARYDYVFGDQQDIFTVARNLAPSATREAVDYFSELMPALAGLKAQFFGHDTLQYKSAVMEAFSGNAALGEIVARLVDGDLTRGSAASDSLFGTNSPDLLLGFEGDDILGGGGSGDAYVHFSGDGHDTLIEQMNVTNYEVDRLVFGVGLNSDEVNVSRSLTDPDDVILSFGSTDSVLIDEQFQTDGSGVEYVLFGDDVVWDRDDLIGAVIEQSQTSGNDVIQGFAGSTTYRFDVLAGNDTISEVSDAADTGFRTILAEAIVEPEMKDYARTASLPVLIVNVVQVLRMTSEAQRKLDATPPTGRA